MDLVPATTTLRGHHVARLTGLSYRQIDYWCRRGVITPLVEADGSGTQRLFTVRQASVLRVLCVLRKWGVDLDRLTGIARRLESEPALYGWLVVPLDASAASVVSDEMLPAALSYAGAAMVVELSGEVDV